MVQRIELKSIIGLMLVGALAGCTGTSTYGTGVTQEAQLLEDVSSIAMLGSKKEKRSIDYTSRPKLVKPPKVASLPSPAEKVESESGYFPTNPEEKRKTTLARIAEAEKNGEALPEDVLAARRESARIGNANRTRGLTPADDKYIDPTTPDQHRAARAEFIKRRAEVRGISGAAPRKYLTEPPQKYRTPEQTAAIGVVGEKERNPYAKNEKTSLFGALFGRKKKTSTPAKTAPATN